MRPKSEDSHICSVDLEYGTRACLTGALERKEQLHNSGEWCATAAAPLNPSTVPSDPKALFVCLDIVLPTLQQYLLQSDNSFGGG